MKWTIDNIASLFLLLFVIIYPFYKGSPENYGIIWEDVSVVATIFYSFLIYVMGFAFGRFKDLPDWLKGTVGFIVLGIIPILSTPFIFGFLRLSWPWAQEIFETSFNLARTTKLQLLIGITALFLLVDMIMLYRCKDSKINYATNLYVSDIPVLIGLIVLYLYAVFMGDSEIQKSNMDHFFEGAIAFQIMFSNIIWMYNDDNFWRKILKT